MRCRLFPNREVSLLCGLLLLALTTISRGEESAPSDRPKKLEVNFWVVEVPLDKLRNAGFTWAQLTPNGFTETSAKSIESITQTPISIDQLPRFLKSLEQNNLARTLCEPTLITLDGRPASLAIAPYLEFEMVPIVLGNGNARLEYRIKISLDSPEQDADNDQSQKTPQPASSKSVTAADHGPSLIHTTLHRRPTSFKSDAAAELELGKVSLVSRTRIDRPAADGKSQPTEVLVMARVSVLTSSTLPTGR
jgi:hypothetical protein